MNCHEAQNALFADRDDPLAASQRVALEAHVATCAECQRVRDGLASALSTWRHQVAATAVPDAEREWHAVRRRIRSGDTAGAGRTRGGRFSWFALPLSAAAAALAVALYVGPFSLRTPEASSPGAHLARTNANASETIASNLVFVDDKSGWLVVWSNESNSKQL